MVALKEPVLLTPLRRIAHPKGDVLHAMKRSDPGFADFGEAYFSTVLPGETKGWKRHRLMQLNLVVPVGMVRFHVHDAETGKTERYDIGDGHYARLTVPAGYWVAFGGISDVPSLLLNLASIEHDPEEAQSVPLETYPLE